MLNTCYNGSVNVNIFNDMSSHQWNGYSCNGTLLLLQQRIAQFSGYRALSKPSKNIDRILFVKRDALDSERRA